MRYWALETADGVQRRKKIICFTFQLRKATKEVDLLFGLCTTLKC